MLPPRTGKILNYIVQQYIERAVPVPSQYIADHANLGVSPATIRNEMAFLEKEGYLIRPHTSAGCIPSDRGYRHYVESIDSFTLPEEEQHLISHVFHQAEPEVEVWVSLGATLLARLVRNVAVVSVPKSSDCRLKHMELIAVHDRQALLVVVLDGARVKQKLIKFAQPVAQPELTTASNRLNSLFEGLTAREVRAKRGEESTLEKEATDHLVEIMEAEDRKEYQEPYLEGWHFILTQPEFAHSERMRSLMELVENRALLKAIAPERLSFQRVHVMIGKENQSEAMQNCSVVLCRYGLPDEASGTIAVVGPTRMPYVRAISTVHYLSSVLTRLVAGLYGRRI
ncbi:MAG: heat-inducible transcriptional repressor HrcA [Dehalococcoidales bacterium]|nr:heat-inducible transcriptional repressor HrcA [Dehalococcoidales bacterium]